MIRSYFTIALRNLAKERGYSFMKIAGLALGLAASMIIFLYVKEDLSYDTFHSRYKNIVRVLTIDSADGVSSKLVGVTQPQLGPVAEQELPEVLKSMRIIGGGRYDLSYEGNAIKCEAAFRVDPTFFDVFDFPVVQGAKMGILDKPGSIAITRTLAKKIFGNEDPVGKTLKLNQQTELNVTAVLADPPKNSHLQFDLLRTLVPGQGEDGLKQALETWQGIFCFTYLLLDKPAEPADLNAKLQAISKKNNASPTFTPVMQRLEDIHLHAKDILFETNANKTDLQNVYVLSTIAILILLLAVVNFMNLVTAKSAGRAREVGMRKVIGAVRRQLIVQHLTESTMVTLFSAIVALAVVSLCVPFLNNIYQRYADVGVLARPVNLVAIAALVLTVGVLAGIYPAFVLSSFKPVMVLKGAFKNSSAGVGLRKALVVLQFTISIALMVGTGIVYQQMKYIYTADLGYNRDQVITMQLSGAAVNNATTFRTELLRNKNIIAAGTSSTSLGQQLGRTNIVPEGADASQTNIITSVMAADASFLHTMDMKILEGRDFSLDYDDSLSMIINEEMARFLKWDHPVGKKISLQSGPNPTDLTAYTVVGAVKDFHFATIRHKLEPMFMLYSANNGALSVRISGNNISETIAYIKDTWNKVNAGSTFEYDFLDEQFAALYRNEQSFASMFTHFTALAIVIAGLGLFALSAFTVEQRRKEIGIRKVLGAGNGTILYRLTSEFIKLVLIAFVLASAVGYYAMNQWLADFQYHIDIGAGIFLGAGLLSVLIALLTISFQALKAAFSNPADSLRVE
jgi:putative ABC transport system permease protein